MRLLSRVGGAGAAVGPGTPARRHPVPRGGAGGGIRHPAHRARGSDAPRASRRTRVCRRRRGAGAAAPLAGEAVARLAVRGGRRAARGPAGPMITHDAYRVLHALDGVKDVNIDIVWEPYWTPERIDPKIRALMGL